MIEMKSQKAKCGIAVKCERPRPIAPSAPFKKTPQGVFFIAIVILSKENNLETLF